MIQEGLVDRVQAVNLDSKVWQKVMKRREVWWRKQAAGMTDREVTRTDWYRRQRVRGLTGAEIRETKRWKEYKKGKTAARIASILLNWYSQDKKRSPWEFVRVEYPPPKKIRDFMEALALRRADEARTEAKKEVGAIPRYV